MKTSAKVDANQAEIVAALRKYGCSVEPLHRVGKGVPDLLVGISGVNILIEVKDGDKIPSKRKLTKDQLMWHGLWMGQVAVAESVEEAISIVQKITDVSEWRRNER